MARYTPYAIELQPTGAGSATILGGITAQGFDTGSTVTTQVTAGNPNASYGEITSIKPTGTVTTHSVSTLLSLIGISGSCLSGTTAPGFGLWALQRTACGGLVSGSNHTKYIIPTGIIVPRSLSASHGSRATLSAEVISYYDGTNAPLQISGSQAAPTNLPQDTIGFHLGDVTIGGKTTVSSKTSVEINFGISVQPQEDDGDVHNAQLFVAEVKPTVTITFHNLAAFAAGEIPLLGLHGTHANTSIVLRKKTHGTAGYSTGTDHIELTIDGIATVRSLSANGHNPYAMQLQFDALDDNTNAMIVAAFDHELA